MDSIFTKKTLVFLMLGIICGGVLAQNTVPLGIHYQAVARDNYGNELVNRRISVKFSIISGNPLGPTVYQELHQDVPTSPFGVFSIIIGKGVPTGSAPYGELSEITWDQAFHYLKVEVKFENDFMDMGTMQFLAVPYALYAQKSLEPGPPGPQGEPGPKGDPGDPASDNQTLSVMNIDGFDYLVISGGNQVKISNIEKDGDPTNEIQDLVINSDVLKITNKVNATEWSLTKYLQSLTWNPTTRKLGISDNATTIDLTELKNDADADPTNELQSLTFDKSTGNISITGRPNININNPVGFKAKKSTTQTGLTMGTTYPFINSEVEFIENSCYDSGTGSLTAPIAGIYTFNIYYKADGSGSARVLSLLKNGSVYEIIGPDISASSELNKWVTMKLDKGNIVSLTINTGMSTYSGTGSFVGYKVN